MQSRVINGRTFELDPVPALQGFALQPLIAPAAGRVVGAILRLVGDDEGLSLETLDLQTLMARAPELAAEFGDAMGALKPADLVLLVRGLLGAALVDRTPLFPTSDDRRFNEIFRGRTRDLWLLLWFAVQVNYPDFFPARVANAGAAAGSPSVGSTTSPGAGPSTGSSTPAS